MSNKLEAADLKKYLMLAFGLRMFGSVAYSMMIQYYYGYGDSFTFFDGSNFFTDQISKKPSDFTYLFASFKETSEWYDSIITKSTGYFYTPSNNMVMRISAILSYLSFNKFLIIALFFGFYSFVGQWRLFQVFDDLNKQRNRKLLAFAVLFSPSIWFWGSGLLKDSICLGSLGFIIHILYNLFEKKKFTFKDLLFLCFLVYIVAIIKSYIIIIVCVGIALMVIIQFFKSIKNKVFRLAAILFALLFTGIILYNSDFTDVVGSMAEGSITQIKEFQQSYVTLQEADENSKAGFGLGELDGSINNLILKSPLVIFTCLFRPFLWESKKLIILFTSLESTLLLLSTLFVMIRMGFIHFFVVIFSKPYLLFCFSISIIFALVIGFTTFNFGTMIRYKIIFLPFYYFLLVHLYATYIVGKKLPLAGTDEQPIN